MAYFLISWLIALKTFAIWFYGCFWTVSKRKWVASHCTPCQEALASSRILNEGKRCREAKTEERLDWHEMKSANDTVDACQLCVVFTSALSPRSRMPKENMTAPTKLQLRIQTAPFYPGSWRILRPWDRTYMWLDSGDKSVTDIFEIHTGLTASHFLYLTTSCLSCLRIWRKKPT
jgi:hypothetical protein